MEPLIFTCIQEPEAESARMQGIDVLITPTGKANVLRPVPKDFEKSMGIM